MQSLFKNCKPKKEKFFTNCKLAKINERKKYVFHNNKNDKKDLISVKLWDNCLRACYELH